MARILGIDYGKKRVGLAVTDPLQIIVTGLTSIDRQDLTPFLQSYMSQEKVERIVIGYPSHEDGNRLNICEEIDDYIESEIKTTFHDLPISLQDENYTSVEARRILYQSGLGRKKRRDKKLLDEVSAVLILQRYLGHV